MSLKIRASVESRVSMIFKQTTHLAILLSLLGSLDCVTEYRAPQCGQKKVRPSGIGPVRGRSAPPYSKQIYASKNINSSVAFGLP